MFKDFGRKVQRDVKKVVDARLRMSEELSQGRIKVGSENGRGINMINSRKN
jgi:actin-related protein 3